MPRPGQKQVDWRALHAARKKRKSEEIEKYLINNEKLQKEIEEETFNQEVNGSEMNYHKRVRTLSMAVPGSILDSVPCPELQTYLVGQVSRAACIFKVDEIVVFDDTCSNLSAGDEENESITWENCKFFVKILEYLECPQYLRKLLYSEDKHLMYVGLLNPVGAPHHFRANQHSNYREGIIIGKKNSRGTKSFADVGLPAMVKLDRLLDPGTRVTVKLPPKCQGSHKLNGVVASSWEPKAKLGMYWGYKVRLASSISKVFAECPYKKGYNLTIGTSDKGLRFHDVTFKKHKKLHTLVMFGGLKGLEFALVSDNNLEVDDVSLLFDHYLNTCPNQGTRTIRTEEAIFISLSVVTNKLLSELEDPSSEGNAEKEDK